jgi:Archaeal phage integrase
VAHPGEANELHEIAAKTTSPKRDSNPRPKVYETFLTTKSEALRAWLQSQGKTRCTVREIVIFANKYGHILDSGDASCLASLSPRNKHHAMTALANLAKYQGRYDQWLQIRQRYNLKWTSGNYSMQAMQRFFDPELSLDKLLDKIRNMMQVLPTAMAVVVRHALLTGLRPAEACESVRLLNGHQMTNYYNPERQCLEHFRFPQFQRTTKKCYISYITKEQLSPIVNLGCKTSTPTYNAIGLACRRRKINMDMRYCRKIFGSWLHQSGIASENIDFLQGRTSPSVFSRHYLTPSQDLKDRVLDALKQLQRQL